MPYTKEESKFRHERSFYGDGWWERTCVVCGDKFDTNQSYAKYCSQRCANDAAIARRKERMNKRRDQYSVCPICGNPIEQNEKTKIRRYCSNSCKQKAYRARKADVSASKESAEALPAKKNIQVFGEREDREAARKYAMLAKRLA